MPFFSSADSSRRFPSIFGAFIAQMLSFVKNRMNAAGRLREEGAGSAEGVRFRVGSGLIVVF